MSDAAQQNQDKHPPHASTPGGWIGVDMDGTLAMYGGWRGADHIGPPIAKMVNRVKVWLSEGKSVKIFTARMAGHGLAHPSGDGWVDVIGPIERWCQEHLGTVLPVTNVKDFSMIELWDDRAIQIIENTGVRADGKV